MNAKELHKERQQLFENLYDGIIPKRVPIMAGLSIEFCIEYAGMDLAKTQWTFEGLDEACAKSFPLTTSDTFPMGFAKSPVFLEILQARSFKMGSDGFIQHPEVQGMLDDEYDEFIKNPYDFTLEKIMPRLFPALDTDPVNRSFVMAKAFKADADCSAVLGQLYAKYSELNGYYSDPPGTSGLFAVPLDSLADFKRGFTGITKDIKRNPQKVKDACDALLPYMVMRATPVVKSNYGQSGTALHMAPYLNTKDFEGFYWSGLEKIVNKIAERGQRASLFCEQDWMRYLDYLQELPASTILYFEYGDAQKIKDQLGKKHIITGLYPLVYLKTATKQQCIDKAKELIDILAPGGNYYFNFDKGPLTVHDFNIENYQAVMQYIYENTNYDNAGQKSTEYAPNTPFKKFDIPEFKSKYYTSWEDYKKTHNINTKLEDVIAPKIQGYEEMIHFMVGMWT